MNILVDSDVVIDFLKGEKKAVAFFEKTIFKKNIFISVISWAEIIYGFRKIKAINKEKLFEDFLEENEIKIIPIDKNVAEKYLKIKIILEKKNIPLADFDLLIAATALFYNLSLATRNRKHFKRVKDLVLV